MIRNASARVFTLAGGLLLTVALSMPAAADDFKRFYVSLGGGWESRTANVEVEDVQFTSWKDGYDMSAAFGVRIVENLRVEAEWNNFKNDVDTNSNDIAPPPDGWPEQDANGDATLTAWMLNVGYDIPFGSSEWTANLGAGFGSYKTELDGLASETLAAGGLYIDGSSDYESAWQFKAGVSWSRDKMIEIGLGYRYFDGSELPLDATIYAGDVPVFDLGPYLKPTDTEVHAVDLTVRVNF